MTGTKPSVLAAAALALAASSCTFRVGVRMPEELLQPAAPAGYTAVLPVETQTAAAAWEGGAVRRVTDADTGTRCIEWYANPATSAEAKTVVPRVDVSRYHALRLEWKYMGGGSSLIVQAGKRRWYLFKEKYRPDVWNDMWLDLSLDDDMGGPVLDDEGNLVLSLSFGNYALNRTGEETWRRIRVRNIRLVGFPVLLDCDPRSIAVTADAASLRTTYPLRLRNVSARRLPVELSTDPRAALRFDCALESETVVLQPGETRTVRLSFSMPAARARDLPPLYFEEVPVYARVPGDPESLTTWYRGYVQWMTGGVVPPKPAARPLMLRPGTRERILAAARTDPRAKAALDAWIAKADAALKRELNVPTLRHGYSGNYACAEHQCMLIPDPVNYRHRCPKGNHEVVGNVAADKAVALIGHTRNSDDCAALGWGYYLTGKEIYAEKAAEILAAYGAAYPGWEYARKESLGLWSRVAHAVLGECWWIHGMVEGYDLTAASPAFDAKRRAAVEQGLFLTAAEAIQSHRIAANQQCEVNDASGGAAVNAGNWYLAARVFTGTYGLFDMVSLTFSEEGFSRENELPYHLAAMYPIVQQGLSYEALGGDFFTPAVKRIFDAPLFQSITQTLPNPLYEIAWARYRDPAYLRSVRALRAGGRPFSREVLTEGTAELPADTDSGRLTSTSLDRAGKTILRSGTVDDSRAVQISWGAPTWRGGRDFLNWLAFFRGTPINTSICRIGYSYGLPALSYTTLAGNVPEVDGLVQTGIRPVQAALLAGDFPAVVYRAPAAAPLYPGTDITRTIAIVGDAVVVADRVAADTPRRISFVFYPGTPEISFEGASSFTEYPAFQKEGARYETVQAPARAAVPGGRFSVSYRSGPKATLPTRATFLLDGESEVVRGNTWNQWHPVLTPMVAARRTAAAASCVIVLEAGEKETPLRSVERVEVRLDGKPLAPHQAVGLRLATATQTWLLVECGLPGRKEAAGVATEEPLLIRRLD